MVPGDLPKNSKIPSLLVVVAVWTVTPLIRRRMVDRMTVDKEDSSIAVQVVLLLLGLSYCIAVVSQFCMQHGPAARYEFLTHVAYLRRDGIVVLCSSSCLTLLSNLVLTRLLVLHNPGTVMPMLNACANLSTYVGGAFLYGNGVTREGLLAKLCLSAGKFLLNSATPESP